MGAASASRLACNPPMSEAISNIWRRPLRTALTILGIVIGVFALTVMGAGIFVYPLLWLLVPAAGPNESATSGLHETLRKGRGPRS